MIALKKKLNNPTFHTQLIIAMEGIKDQVKNNYVLDPIKT